MSGLDGSDLPIADRLNDLQRFLKRELDETYPLPLPRSLVPQEDFPARRVLGPTGDGWIGIENSREEAPRVDSPRAVPTFKRRAA